MVQGVESDYAGKVNERRRLFCFSLPQAYYQQKAAVKFETEREENLVAG